MFSRGAGMSTSTVISWWKPRCSSILAAATLPAAMARMALAGPVTQSPPANTLFILPTWLELAATKVPRLMGTPDCSNPAISMP